MKKKVALGIMAVVVAGLLAGCDDGGMRLDTSLPNDGVDPLGKCQLFGGDGCVGGIPEPDPADADDEEALGKVDEPLRCPIRRPFQGKAGQPFRAQIDMIGGSGEHVLEMKNAPQWLSIVGDTIEAKKPLAGNFSISIAATDESAGMAVECEFSLNVAPVFPATATRLSKVEKAQIDILQSSSSVSNAVQASAQPSLDAAETETQETSDPQQSASNTKNPTPSFPVTSIIIELTTGGPVIHGNLDWSKSKCTVGVRFCTTANGDSCTAPAILAPEGGFPSKTTTSFSSWDDSLESLLFQITPNHKYFDITLNTGTGDCAKDTYMTQNDAWLFRMIDVRMRISDGTEYRYLNPCLGRWMSPGDTLRFGPNDTAVCAVVTTDDADGAGTDDDVFLLMDANKAVTNIDWQQGSKSAEWGPHPVLDTNQLNHPLLLNWKDSLPDNYDDFEKGMKTSYGFFAFSSNPFGTSFQFSKEADGKNGEWTAAAYDVYLYHPGDFGNKDNKIWSANGAAITLTDISTQWTDKILLSEMSLDLDAFIAIGAHH